MEAPFWWHLVAVAGAQFCFIFLRAFQQRSVIHNTRWAIVPTSFAMAMFEVFVYASIARAAILLGVLETALTGLAMGVGGGTGCLVAMLVHDRVLRRKNG